MTYAVLNIFLMSGPRMDGEVFDRNRYVAGLLRLLGLGLRHLVNELLSKKGQTVYLCGLGGFGYADLETAERCGQYCHTHLRRQN
jgi:hypothetical protein